LSSERGVDSTGACASARSMALRLTSGVRASFASIARSR